VIENLKHIEYFLAEDVRTARRFLSSLKIYESIEVLRFEVLNKDTQEKDLSDLLKPLKEGKNVGVISESGCPGVADPGALAAAYAHTKNIKVVPLVGPSSILLALMASGLNGQQFSFHGYLPIEAKEAAKKIKELERESGLKSQTQIFIETPYRNNQVLKYLIDHLSSESHLCVAVNLTGKGEFIKMQTVSDWRKSVPALPKEPAVFLFLARQ
jgi:16S rRNA (cytidine1402-2'-O)-methyltransferase